MAARASYEQWFHSADKDRNGYLNTKELKKALKAKGYKTSRKQFKEQFKQFDRDGDKKITLQEYLIAMGQVPEVFHKEATIRQAFERADKNRDGTLDFAELNSIFHDMKAHVNPDELFQMVHEIDKDKSGKINYNEFLAYFLKKQGFFGSGSDDDSDWD